MPIRLVLADDHPVVLAGLEHYFRREPDLEVVAGCTDGEQALETVRERRPEILILDIKMPGMDGLTVLRRIREERLPTEVILLTASLKEKEVVEAVRLGIKGLLLKGTEPKILVQAVREVHEGGQWLDQRLVGQALAGVLQREAAARQTAEVLTQREIEVIRMVATGLRNREIAEELCISEGTVKTHLHNIYEKLEVKGRLELTLYAQQQGLV